MNMKLTWKEIRTQRWSLTWKLWTPMSGGLKRNFYGWSFGCRFGGMMFTRFATACFLTIALSGCANLTPAQVSTAQALSSIAIGAAANYYHLPPNDAQVLIAASSSLWGAGQQAQAGQPVAQGATAAPIGNAIAAFIPAGAQPNATAAVLQQAATLVAKTNTAP